MIIHHEDGTKMVVEKITGARMSNGGKCFITFRSPATQRKGIVEMSGPEMVLVLKAASKLNTEAEDKILGKLR
jgi:hypothetical protein